MTENGEEGYDWRGIIGGYILIGIVGSLAIVVGAVAFNAAMLEHALVKTFGRLDPPPTIPTGARPKRAKPTAMTPTRWAIIKTPRAKTYGRTGKFLMRVQHGTIVGICRIKENIDGDLALCRMTEGGKQRDVYIRTHDLAIQSGPPDHASEAEKTLRVRKVELEADIELRRSEQLKRSPYYQEYKEALDAYLEFGERVTALRAQRDAARGADHMAVSDELRKLKNDGAHLKIAHDQSKAKLVRWRDQQKSGLSSDPTVRRLQGELAQVNEQIRRIEQGL